eukprot:g42975.t1
MSDKGDCLKSTTEQDLVRNVRPVSPKALADAACLSSPPISPSFTPFTPQSPISFHSASPLASPFSPAASSPEYLPSPDLSPSSHSERPARSKARNYFALSKRWAAPVSMPLEDDDDEEMSRVWSGYVSSSEEEDEDDGADVKSLQEYAPPSPPLSSPTPILPPSMSLFEASEQGRIESVQRWLDIRSRITSGHEGFSASLRAGAEVTQSDESGITPLHAAAKAGHAQVVSLLVQHKASVSQAAVDGATPLLACASAGHLECCRVLVMEGYARVDQADHKGLTPLSSACAMGHLVVVQLLVASRAALEGIPRHGDRHHPYGSSLAALPPLHCAARHGRIDIVKFLVRDCGSDLEQVAPIASLTLSSSTAMSSPSAAIGRSKHLRPDKGKAPIFITPLIAAVLEGRLEVAQFLVATGAKVNPNTGPPSALMAAAVRRHLDLVEWLVSSSPAVLTYAPRPHSAPCPPPPPALPLPKLSLSQPVAIMASAAASVTALRRSSPALLRVTTSEAPATCAVGIIRQPNRADQLASPPQQRQETSPRGGAETDRQQWTSAVALVLQEAVQAREQIWLRNALLRAFASFAPSKCDQTCAGRKRKRLESQSKEGQGAKQGGAAGGRAKFSSSSSSTEEHGGLPGELLDLIAFYALSVGPTEIEAAVSPALPNFTTQLPAEPRGKHGRSPRRAASSPSPFSSQQTASSSTLSSPITSLTGTGTPPRPFRASSSSPARASMICSSSSARPDTRTHPPLAQTSRRASSALQPRGRGSSQLHVAQASFLGFTSNQSGKLTQTLAKHSDGDGQHCRQH